MLIYTLKRIGSTSVTMLAVSVIIFALTQVLPGNAANMILGAYSTEERVAAVEAQLGLNRPAHVQYVEWITGVLTGDWGQSLIHSKPVLEVVLPRAVRSLQLTLVTTAIVVLVAIPLGVAAAKWNGSALSSLIMIGSYTGVSIASFVLATVLLLLLGGPILNVFPAGGYEPLRAGVVPWLTHLLLPAITLSVGLTAHVVRQTRSGLLEAIQSEYVRTARLKGLGEVSVLFKHALRNGILPTITIIALNFGYLMGGVVIVEEIFFIPGLGRLIVQAVQDRDLPVIQAGTLLIAFTYVLANFGADVLYTYLDPRITYGGGE
jgi:peptide/nickel transport system permease protein